MRKIKEIIDEHKAKAQFEREAEIKSEFLVVERNGALWLTHAGIAFKQVESGMSSEEVAKEVNAARETAIKFARL